MESGSIVKCPTRLTSSQYATYIYTYISLGSCRATGHLLTEADRDQSASNSCLLFANFVQYIVASTSHNKMYMYMCMCTVYIYTKCHLLTRKHCTHENVITVYGTGYDKNMCTVHLPVTCVVHVTYQHVNI